MGATSRVPLITTSQLQEITATLSEGCGSELPTPTRGLNCMWPVHDGSMNGGAGLFRGALLVHLNSTPATAYLVPPPLLRYHAPGEPRQCETSLVAPSPTTASSMLVPGGPNVDPTVLAGTECDQKTRLS